jgi:hypothetical protein
MTRVALIAVGLLIAVALVWDASERHYYACVNAAIHDGADPLLYTHREDPTGDKADRASRRIDRRIRGCSRLPW